MINFETVIEISSDEEPVDPEPAYLTGKCLLTRAAGHTTGITLETLIHKASLQKAVFSSFVVNKGWLERFLRPDVSVCLIEDWDRASGKPGAWLVGPKYLVVHPPFKGYGCMHAKLMLLIYPGFLRLVIGSANLVDYDWELIENMVYVQDFPRKPKPNLNCEDKLGQDILRFLNLMTVPDSVGEVVKEFDFSKAPVELVFSVPGKWGGEVCGLDMLGSKLNGLLPQNGITKASLCYQTSSLGEITLDFIREFWKCVYPSLGDDPKPDFKVVFPSRETVQTSLLGPEGGGTIFFNCKSFYKPSFPRWVFHDSISLRQGALSHSKIIVGEVSVEANSGSFTRDYRWFYCGSHNFTTSAWGRALKPSDSGLLHRHINNYELGVVGLDLKTPFSCPFLYPPPAYRSIDVPSKQNAT